MRRPPKPTPIKDALEGIAEGIGEFFSDREQPETAAEYLERIEEEERREQRRLERASRPKSTPELEALRKRFIEQQHVPLLDHRTFVQSVMAASSIPQHLRPLLTKIAERFIDTEPHIFNELPPDFYHRTEEELQALDYIWHRHKHCITAKYCRPDNFKGYLARILSVIADIIPPIPDASSSLFTAPLITTLPNAKLGIKRIIQAIRTRQGNDYYYLSSRMERNLTRAGYPGLDDDGDPTDKSYTIPESMLQLNETYFKGTPLFELFNTPIPVPFTKKARFNHMHVLGGAGVGKTVLLENIILHDLKSQDRPALVIVDSQGDLIHKVSHLAMFDRQLREALVLISPKDIRHPPALNIFDVNRSRLATYDEATKEQILAGVIETFDYVFTGLLGSDLTTKQGVFFKFVARLMLALPETLGRNATIMDMLDLMHDAAPYQKAIAAMPPMQRAFFERDFANKTFSQTKEQIRYRLQAIIENPTLARLFSSPYTKVDIFKELNNRSVILVDTAKDFLKGSSGHFGMIFISLVLQAVMERAAIPEKDRTPAFLIVDEAHEYFGSNIDDLLTQARKYRLGCLFAHQYLDQCSHDLKASFAANTGIKFAAGVSTSDARSLAADMRTTVDAILEQPPYHFAAYIRNAMSSAVSVAVPPSPMDKEPRLDSSAHKRLIERNRERVSYKPEHRQPLPSTDWDEEAPGEC